MKIHYFTLLLPVLSTACADLSIWKSAKEDTAKVQHNAQPAISQTDDQPLGWEPLRQRKLSLNQTASQQVQQNEISDYVAVMAQTMAENMRYLSANDAIAIASFVPLESSLESTSVLGLHLAESFIHHMQIQGMEVVDFKTTGMIRVTEQGDFVFSRDTDELKFSYPIEYILSGTYVTTNQGVEVNARVISVKRNNVVASAQSNMKIKTDKLFTTTRRQNIKLVDGND